MAALRAYGWLLVGVVVGIAGPSWGIGARLAALLHGLIPLPWNGIGLGLLFFGAGASLHFRAHWVRSLKEQQIECQRQQAAVRLMQSAGDDGMRWLHAIQENLELVAEGKQRPQEVSLYIEGARAHACKLEQVFQRIDGIRRQLASPSNGIVPPGS